MGMGLRTCLCWCLRFVCRSAQLPRLLHCLLPSLGVPPITSTRAEPYARPKVHGVLVSPTPYDLLYFVLPTCCHIRSLLEHLAVSTPDARPPAVIETRLPILVHTRFHARLPCAMQGWKWMNRVSPTTWMLYGLASDQLGNNHQEATYDPVRSYAVWGRCGKGNYPASASPTSHESKAVENVHVGGATHVR
jgi:hypothetical protein